MAFEYGEFIARKVNKATTYKSVQQRSQLQLRRLPQDSRPYAFILQQPMVVVLKAEIEGVDDCATCGTKNRQRATSNIPDTKWMRDLRNGSVRIGVRGYAWVGVHTRYEHGGCTTQRDPFERWMEKKERANQRSGTSLNGSSTWSHVFRVLMDFLVARIEHNRPSRQWNSLFRDEFFQKNAYQLSTRGSIIYNPLNPTISVSGGRWRSRLMKRRGTWNWGTKVSNSGILNEDPSGENSIVAQTMVLQLRMGQTVASRVR